MDKSSNRNKAVAIIGAGPAGLMAAEVLSLAGVNVAVYDAMPSAGRKFLMAGKGGMNITHAEPFETFLSRYGASRNDMEPILNNFPPDALCNWIHALGISTFVGSSGLVFPREMKAAPLLRAWLQRLRAAGVHFYMRHHWLGWTQDNGLRFSVNDAEQIIQADALVLALGGGSWPQLGSTGAWQSLLHERGVAVAPLQPSNCGFEANWSAYFCNRFAGQPLKPVGIRFRTNQGADLLQQGELMITAHGLEGGAIYALSRALREEIDAKGSALVYLDLSPDRDLAAISKKLLLPKGKDSLSNFLRKRLGIEGVKAALLREVLSSTALAEPQQLAAAIKALPLKLTACRPLAEAISSAGGVRFDALDENLMIRSLPGVFCAGEMLDWEAPTGGYLLTASLASGRAAGLGCLAWFGANLKNVN